MTASFSFRPKSSHGHRRPVSMRGFTVIELLVTIAILAVLLGLAMPSFTGTIQRFRVTQAMDEIQAALLYARSEAVRTRTSVVMRGKALASCRPAGGVDSQDWSCGWEIFSDTNGNNTREDTEPVLREGTESPAVVIVHRGGTSDAFIGFNAMGYSNSVPGMFSVKPKDSNAITHILCINRTARFRRFKEDLVKCPT